LLRPNIQSRRAPFANFYVAIDRRKLASPPWAFNENVSVLFDTQWRRPVPGGFAALTEADAERIRHQLMRELDTGKFVQIRYGTGRRKLFMYTAFDCPWCLKLEQRLTALGSRADVSLYFIPDTLNRADPARQQIAESLYCAPDPGAAWKNWMIKRIPPPVATCPAFAAVKEYP